MRINKSLVATFLALMLSFVVACPGGGDDGDDDDTPTIDSGVQFPDAPPATPDAAPMIGNATNLGKVCGQGMPCPGGEACLVFQGAANGFCSIPCTTQGSIPECSNMFPGPGIGVCILNVQGSGLHCGVGCGSLNMGDETCPTGLTCQDLAGPGGMPDGMKDLCAN